MSRSDEDWNRNRDVVVQCRSLVRCSAQILEDRYESYYAEGEDEALEAVVDSLNKAITHLNTLIGVNTLIRFMNEGRDCTSS